MACHSNQAACDWQTGWANMDVIVHLYSTPLSNRVAGMKHKQDNGRQMFGACTTESRQRRINVDELIMSLRMVDHVSAHMHLGTELQLAPLYTAQQTSFIVKDHTLCMPQVFKWKPMPSLRLERSQCFFQLLSKLHGNALMIFCSFFSHQSKYMFKHHLSHLHQFANNIHIFNL